MSKTMSYKITPLERSFLRMLKKSEVLDIWGIINYAATGCMKLREETGNIVWRIREKELADMVINLANQIKEVGEENE